MTKIITTSELDKFILMIQKFMQKSEYKPLASTKDKLSYLLSQEYIQAKLLWVLPKKIDISKELGLSKEDGKVFALSFPHIAPDIHLKTPIFAGLFLFQILKGNIHKNTTTIVEAGGINTGFGLTRLINLFSLRGKFYTSRFLPQSLLNEILSENIEIIPAQKNDNLGLEEEFYIDFVNKYKKIRYEKNVAALWHIKYSFLIAEILAHHIYESNNNLLLDIDQLITGVGSGASLAILMELSSLNHKSLPIIVAEHEKTPIFWHTKKQVNLTTFEKQNDLDDHFIVHPSNRIPHIVYGPHYEKINNKIPKNYLDKIDSI